MRTDTLVFTLRHSQCEGHLPVAERMREPYGFREQPGEQEVVGGALCRPHPAQAVPPHDGRQRLGVQRDDAVLCSVTGS